MKPSFLALVGVLACASCASLINDPKCVVAPQACAIAQRDADAGPEADDDVR